jgi:hypothetical protein
MQTMPDMGPAVGILLIFVALFCLNILLINYSVQVFQVVDWIMKASR